MAVQQRRKTPSRRGMRRSHDVLSAGALSIDSTTGEVHRRHHVTDDGFYKGNKVVKTAEEESEDWLNEEIDDSLQQEIVKTEQDAVTEEPNKTEEVDLLEGKQMSDKDRIGQAAMGKMALEKKLKPAINLVEPVETSINIKQRKKRASISERTDRFTIQITSKKMLKDAQLFSQNLIGKGYDSYIQKVVFNSEEIWYRVRVGSYDNYNSAKTAADALSSTLGMPTWVDFVRKEQ